MSAKTKFFLKRAGVFLGLLLPALACLSGLGVLCVRYGVFFLGIGPGDSSAVAEVWLDEDGDGQRDPGEPPLENVCIWADTRLPPYNEQWLTQECAADHSFG